MIKLIKTLAVVSVLLFNVVPAVHAQEPIKMDVGSWVASTAPFSVSLEKWKKLVEEKTHGRVKVNIYHGGVLGSSRTALDDIKGGVYQVGSAIPAYYYDTAYFKFLVGELPFSLSGAVVGSKVMTEFVEKHGKDVYDKLGVKNMGMVVTDPYVIFSSKPIRKFDDMKGVRVRAAGKAWVPIAQAWGAVATPIQPEEAYTALERGTLGAMHYTPTGALGWKYFEVAPYVTLINSPTVVVNMIMNKAFFEKLPDDLKKMFDEELNPALVAMLEEMYERGAPAALEKMSAYFKAKGKGEVITLAPEEKAKFVAPAKQAWEDWVREANKRGLPGEALLADYKTILKKNGIAVPF